MDCINLNPGPCGSKDYKRITDVLWQTKVSVTPPSSGYPTGDTSLEATHPKHSCQREGFSSFHY